MRANALQFESSHGAAGARVRALAAYKDFVSLSKDAGVGIPVFKQAKAEYPKHQ